MEELRSILEAYISDLNLMVALHLVDDVPRETTGQMATARRAAKADRVLSVVWVELEDEKFYIFVSDEESEKVLVQTLPQGSEGWDDDCDAIATIIRSSLKPWMENDSDNQATNQATPSAPPPPPIDRDETTEQAQPESSEVPQNSSLHGVVAVGYAASVLDAKKAWVHGLELVVGIQLLEFLEIDLSFYAFQAHDMTVPQMDLRLSRWPIKLSVSGIIPLDPLEIGLRVGVLADFTRVTGIPKSLEFDETNIYKTGFSPSLLFRLKLNIWLSIWADGGVDIFGKDRNYLWNNEIVLVYQNVQPRFSIGLAASMPDR